MKDIVYKYNISGEPVSIFKQEVPKLVRVWSEYAEQKCRYNITLETQHEEKPIIEDNIDMDVKFFVSRKVKKKPRPASVLDMFQFINSVLKGRIYKRDALISNVVLEKIYDQEPHTEIRIIVKKDEDGSKQKKDSKKR